MTTDQNLGVSPKDLLTCFFTECEKQFRFLEQRHHFSYLSGLVKYQGGRQIITPYKGVVSEAPFVAVTRYEKDFQAFEVSYSEDNYAVDCHFIYDHYQRLSFQEVLRAAKKSLTLSQTAYYTASVRTMQSVILDISETLKHGQKTLLPPSEKIIERALTMREMTLEQKIREQYRKSLDMISQKAAKAFTEKDFTAVIELFQPYEMDLSASDRKKLEVAKRKILEV